MTPTTPLPHPHPSRRHLPEERYSITHKFRIGGEKAYLIIGLFPDNSPGEVFIRIAKEGSTLSGALDSFAVMVSMALQHGIPLETMVRKFRGVHFEPFGVTGNKEIPMASSIVDYIFRWMEMRFVKKDIQGVNRDLP